MNKTKIILVLIFSIYYLNGICGDTISIYKNKEGIPFAEYERIFRNEELKKEYPITNFSKIDIKFTTSTTPLYIKVFNSNEKIDFEGKYIPGKGFIGEKKYYYKNGNLRRIENYEKHKTYIITSESYKIEGTAADFPNETLSPMGTWKYFNKNGTLKKTVNCLVLQKDTEPRELYYLRIIRKPTKDNFKVVKIEILEYLN